MQVREIAGYDEDVVFLVVPDKSEFGCRVPLVIGTYTIGRIINVIRESEIDHLSMPWSQQGWHSCFPVGRSWQSSPQGMWGRPDQKVPVGDPGRWMWMNWSQ